MAALQADTFSPALVDSARLAIAALVGLAVGIEREWSGHASGPLAHFAGVRTFFLLGLIGGAAGLLFSWGYASAAVVLIGGAALFVVAAYYMAARRPGADIDGTTESAAMVVLAFGAFAGVGKMALAGGAVAVVVLALREKEGLHSLVRHIGEAEMRAALQFGVLALVVLPLLPAGPYGPFGGVRPRALWSIVLLLAGLNFAGYIARRAVGVARGYTITGMLGGIVSSTAVTLQFARTSKRQPADSVALSRGVIAACTVVLVRVLIVSTVLSKAVAVAAVPYLLPPLIAGVLMTLAALREPAQATAAPEDGKSPLGLGSALKMALAFQLAIAAIVIMQQVWGSTGVITTAALVGVTDMDALTISMSRLGEVPDTVALAAEGIGVGMLSNSIFKFLVAMVAGGPSFRRSVGPRMGVLALASAVGLWLGMR